MKGRPTASGSNGRRVARRRELIDPRAQATSSMPPKAKAGWLLVLSLPVFRRQDEGQDDEEAGEEGRGLGRSRPAGWELMGSLLRGA